MTKWFGNFLFSENRNEYIRIAFEYNSTPWRVYNLAHRSKARSRKEERILMELKERGIITVAFSDQKGLPKEWDHFLYTLHLKYLTCPLYLVIYIKHL